MCSRVVTEGRTDTALFSGHAIDEGEAQRAGAGPRWLMHLVMLSPGAPF
jgi:hypothetical protein